MMTFSPRAFIPHSDPAACFAWLANGDTVAVVLRTDRDWAKIDGEPCRVSSFRPLGAKMVSGKLVSVDSSLPHAVVQLECPKLLNVAEGYIWHKVDFEHLWAAFEGRGVAADEEVLIIWTKRQYRPFVVIFSAFLPKLWVMVWKRGSYEYETDPCLKAQRRPYQDMVPVADWKPEIMS